jgi:hypothetical protein
MSYNSDFEREFIQRSLGLVKDYQGPHDATLLLNCLLGLLVVPKEVALESVPDEPIESLANWGVSPSVIKAYGKPRNQRHSDARRLPGLVSRLRHSIAHFTFRPIPETGEVVAFGFTNHDGFRAEIPLEQLRTLVNRLAEHLEGL